MSNICRRDRVATTSGAANKKENLNMNGLIVLIAIIVVMVILLRSSLGDKLAGGTSAIEAWAEPSIARRFAVPIAGVALAYLVGFLAGQTLLIVQIFANAFLLFILYAFASAFAPRKGIRLGVSMAFLGVMIGSVVGIVLRLNGIV
jgi:hypothetical protein